MWGLQSSSFWSLISPCSIPVLDDILLTGVVEEEHQTNVKDVLGRLAEADLRLKKDKDNFGVEAVKYLGHRITKYELATIESTVRAVVEAPTVSDVTQVKSFLGVLTLYLRLLPHLATILQSLHQLLKTHRLMVLAQFCLFQIEDGEQSIAFHSRSMAPAERNYSQVEKEALAMNYGVCKFYKYLWGRHFKIYMDPKPLLGLL